MPVPGRKITVRLDPDDDSSNVELSLIETLTTEEGSGPYFRRRIASFNNQGGELSSRQVEVKEITHKKRLPEDDDDDPDQKLKVEVIRQMTTTEGAGPNFTKRIWSLNPDIETNLRTTHIKRIKNKDDPDIWIDVRRKDRFLTAEGSGPTFQRRIETLAWDDEADDNAFDKNALPAEPGVNDTDHPVVTDFFQDIVNINLGGPILAIYWHAEFDGSDSSQRALRLVAPSAPKAKPPVTQYGAEFDKPGTVVFIGGAYQSVDADEPSAVNPINSQMRKHLLFWEAPNGVAFPGGAVNDTLLINLARYRPNPLPEGGATVTFKFGVAALAEQKNQYRTTTSFNTSEILIDDQGNPALFVTGHSATSVGLLTVTEAAALEDEFERTALAQGGYDLHFEIEQLTFTPQTTGSWTLKASTYGAKKDFAFAPLTAVPAWNFAKARSQVTKTESGGPMPRRTITIKVRYPELTVTATVA